MFHSDNNEIIKYEKKIYYMFNDKINMNVYRVPINDFKCNNEE